MKPRLLIACGLAGLALSAQADDALVKLTPGQVKSMAIVAQPLAGFASGGERRLPAQAVVPPRHIEVLAAPMAGMVVSVAAAYGETVKKGQVLARLQSAQVLELQREALQARGQARLATENLKRDKTLFDDGIIAAARLSATEVAERQAAAQWSEKRQALALAGASEPAADGAGLSGSLGIRAPFDGVVLESAVQPGSRVEASTLLFKLGRIGALWLEIQATPAQAAGLMPGDIVTVPGCAEKGVLSLVAPAMNPASQSLLLRAEMPKGAQCLKPFQFTQAEVAPAKAGTGWRVPNGALTRHQGQSWLFAETADGYRPIAVRILDETEKSSLIAAELPADMKVVVRGLAAVKAAWLGLGAGGQ